MPRKAAAKKTTFGADLIEGMKQVLAHQRGKIELEQVWPKPIDVKAIRQRVKMSQAEFARTYRIGQRASPAPPLRESHPLPAPAHPSESSGHFSQRQCAGHTRNDTPSRSAPPA